jgi:RNA polymerase sigma-70 factor (ECF subfamily)
MTRPITAAHIRAEGLPEGLGLYGKQVSSRADLPREPDESVEDYFIRIWEAYKNMLLRMVWFRLRNSTVAQDIISQTYLKAFVAIKEQGVVVEHIKAWLCKIANNLCVDYFRRFYYPTQPWPISLEDAIEEPYDGLTNQLTIGRFLDIILVRRALRQLELQNERWGYVLRKIYFEGFKHEELAKQLRLTVGAVKALQHRAIVQLRFILDDLVIEPF